MRVKYVLNEVLVGLWRNVTMTVAMIITMSVSLTMLGASVLLYMQVDQMKNFYYGEIEVSIFLREDVSDPQRTAINQAIDSNPLVDSKTLAPSMVNDTDMVMIMATVIVTLRHRPTRTSLRTYFTRIEGFLPGPRVLLHYCECTSRCPVLSRTPRGPGRGRSAHFRSR